MVATPIQTNAFMKPPPSTLLELSNLRDILLRMLLRKEDLFICNQKFIAPKNCWMNTSRRNDKKKVMKVMVIVSRLSLSQLLFQ